jgi:thiamine kinase-like enzyme
MSIQDADSNLFKAIEAYGLDAAQCKTEPVGNGLINFTYKVSFNSQSLLLQKLNGHVFKNPRHIIQNYLTIYSYLSRNGHIKIPEPVKTKDQNNCFTDPDMNCWRALEFIENGIAPEQPSDPRMAFEAARCFGNFTCALAGMKASSLHTIIPHFHDLSFRFIQFQNALETGIEERKSKAAKEIQKLLSRKKLVDFYCWLIEHPGFKLRVMHHDAKLSNILFNQHTGKVICLVDLDTTQSGYFFSDLGDMIRSMACSASEHATDFSALHIQPAFYEALLVGYQAALNEELTPDEKKYIHMSGLMMIYMQALRYMTDYLNGDVYYRISHPEQNVERTRNQLALLNSLEHYLKESFDFTV